MKYLLCILISLSAFFAVSANDLPEHLTELAESYENKMKVWAVDDDDFEDENDNEFFVLKFCSRQDDNDKSIRLNYLMRVTVQLTDRKTDTVVFAQSERKRSRINNMIYYADQTDWEFHIPFDGMKKPKLTAYVIEFGFRQDGYFVPVAVESDEVESADEILNGEGNEVNMIFIHSKHRWYGD